MSLRVRCALLAALYLCGLPLTAAERPNILWIVLEDISPELGVYGDPYAVTPNIDRFAREGVVYTHAYSNGGACAPARSTLITGMYAPGIGTHHMRSSGRPPSFVRGFTEYLREAGYYTSNHSKTDYNWTPPKSTWDVIDADWRGKGWDQRGDKPFFTVVNITDTHSSQTYHPWVDWRARRSALEPEQRHDPAQAIVPPFYPDTPETRTILARYADNITFADRIVGEVLAKLKDDGLAGDTIVFFYSDHGTGLPRSKSFQFESSTRVPLIIRFPEKFKRLASAGPGERVHNLVSFVDFAPTVLSLAGVDIPDHFQGKAFLGPAAGEPRWYVFGYRDRMDERYEFIRSVRGGRFRYIRNYFPHTPWFLGQTRLYPSTNPLLETWTRLALAEKLRGPAAIYMARTKPREQLFDSEADPHEVRDLAADPKYADVLAGMRSVLKQWTFAIGDLGFLPESEMWRRFDGRAYDAIRERRESYPLDRIWDAAELAGSGGSAASRQADLLKDSDPTVRFWAATGLLAQGSGANRYREPLREALADESPDVRTVAAQALCSLGECGEALRVLVANLNDSGDLQQESLWVAVRAANALDHLDGKASPVLSEMKKHLGDASQLRGRAFFRQARWPQWVLKTAIKELE